MKKLNIICFVWILFLSIPNLLNAQSEAVVHWSQPAAFIPTEKVSFFFDVTGTKLEGEKEISVHTWYPTDQTGRPAEELALTYVSENIFRWDIVPTEFYQMSAENMYSSTSFYGMLRTSDWSKADVYFTPDIEASQIKLYDLSTIKGSSTIVAYPEKFTQTKPVSFIINSKNTWSSNSGNGCVQGELFNAEQVVAHSGVNDWSIVVPSDQPKARLTDIGDGLWRMDVILKDYYELPEEYELENISMVFASVDWKWQGIDTGCNDFRILAPDLPVPPEPSFYLFPLKVSKNDILSITRENNNKGQQLSYTITAGSKIIKGNLEGGMARQRVYINLGKELSGVDASKMHILVEDQRGNMIHDEDMPLEKVDNLTK